MDSGLWTVDWLKTLEKHTRLIVNITITGDTRKMNFLG